VIVDDFDIERTRLVIGPLKTDSPLFINSDTELTGSISSKGFKAVASQALELVNVRGGIEYFQSSIGLPLK